MARLCLLTPSPDYPNPWAAERDALLALLRSDGTTVDDREWASAEAAALAGYDLVLPLMAWPYVAQAARWFALLDDWQAAGVAVRNPPALLRWNSDKAYLPALATAGVAVVPTLMSAALDDAALAVARGRWGGVDLVVKPPISAGASGTYRLPDGAPVPGDMRGRPMLVQPLMPAIASEGEYSLFLFGGALSHAIVKRPGAGDFRVQAQFGGREWAVPPPEGALALARAALEAACRLAGVDGPPLYARVDLVRNPEGALALMELELIEPSLFLPFAADGGEAFARAVRASL